MKQSRIFSIFCACASFFLVKASFATSVTKHPFTVDDLWTVARLSEPVSSPNGEKVLFTVKTTDMAANKGRTDIWIAEIDGSSVKPLVDHKDNDSNGTFSPDGQRVLFLSSRSGSSQVWQVDVKGGAATQLTALPTDVNDFKVFPDGKTLLLALEVFPSAASLADSLKKDEEIAKRQGKYQRYDALLFRHWDKFEDGKRNHLFVWRGDQSLVDVTKGMDADAPTLPFGGMEEIAISKDGKHIVFAARSDGYKAAWTNNIDLFSVASSGQEKPKNITSANLAVDGAPVFSPDGKTLAYLAMGRAGYESDRQRIILMDWKTKKTRVLTEAWDRSVSEYIWSRDGSAFFVSADNLGNHSLFSVDANTGVAKTLLDKGENAHPSVAGNRIVILKNNMTSPHEVWSLRQDGTDLKPVTTFNSARAKGILWGDYEQFSFPGHKGETVYGYIVKPAGFAGKGKVPVAFLIHGGPQTSFSDRFHYRWNPQVFAGKGYATVFIDYHGSSGYGQNFTDSIRENWGGAPYEDLMKGLDFALAKYSYLDGKNVFALGASYGGYMVNWINGNTDRFKAIVCHDGNLDEEMAYYNTEELWFPEWDHGGLPWENQEKYQKHNPINLVKNWKTPTLVIHGGKDYRVVSTQGMSTFTALQRRGIKSRFLYFPEENHWILKPQDSLVWHREIFSWLAEFK